MTPKPTPEELLRRVEAEERHGRRGRLKIFLGYAPGVGKSFRMLDEGRRRKLRGQDVVVGAVQPGPSAEAAQLLAGFEIVPPLAGPSGGARLDVPAILRRRPALCLVDGLAYRNPPGSAHEERWQDVQELLAAGVAVIATINLQYVKERQGEVERIRGKRVTDSVPESFLRTADDIEVVDAPPEYCVERAAAAAPGGPGLADAGTLERQLRELREIALLLAADVVEAQLDEYLKRHGIGQSYGAQERVVVCVTPRSNAALMIARGRRQADRFHGELFAVYFDSGPLAPADRAALDAHLQLARQARAQVEVLHGEDFVAAVTRFCARHGITQIFVGHSQRTGWWQRIFANPVERLIAGARGLDIRVFPNRRP
ncbi:MAG: hypothetical protein IT162_23355 [Bryobacterales bacterium]|nr:hypothetical protein [Bryobacterales bacterium]